MALHHNIKKSLLFTVHIVDNKITCVRCNLTGKFVKRNVYFAIEKETTTEYGSITYVSITYVSITYVSITYVSITYVSITYVSITDFNAVSLFGVVTSNNYINVLNVLFLALFSVLAVSLINLFL